MEKLAAMQDTISRAIIRCITIADQDEHDSKKIAK
jgi:hypothetical protein